MNRHSHDEVDGPIYRATPAATVSPFSTRATSAIDLNSSTTLRNALTGTACSRSQLVRVFCNVIEPALPLLINNVVTRRVRVLGIMGFADFA